jgi:hypothetical protein
MHVPTTRSFTPSRVIALALIAVLASGLAYLRFAPDTGSVSVPEGAKAGDVVLERGEYGGYEADRGTLVVPEDRSHHHDRRSGRRWKPAPPSPRHDLGAVGW